MNSFVRDDVPQFAIYQIVAFRGEQTAVKIINTVVAHWLNILCKRGGVKCDFQSHSKSLSYCRLIGHILFPISLPL